MKTTMLTAALAVVVTAAFGQGKVQVQNDGSRLVVILSAGNIWQPVPVTVLLPSGISLVFGLYAGTSSTFLSLISTYPINPPGGNAGSITPGQIASSHCILPFPGGSVDYFMVKVWDGAFASWEACLANPSGATYLSFGQSIFTMTPGTGIAYPAINNGGGTTWPAAPIYVYGPEPSAMALATLAVVMGVLRRTLNRR